MTPELAAAARALLAVEAGEVTSSVVAARGAQVFEQLVPSLSRLLGEDGIRMLVKRSVRLASASFPWLASSNLNEGSDGPVAGLRTCLESESPEAATEAFVLVLSTLVGLLTRLIGEGLMTRVLHELWPAIFPSAAKE